MLMKIVQFFLPAKERSKSDSGGPRRVGIILDNDILDITSKYPKLTTSNQLLAASYKMQTEFIDYLNGLDLKTIDKRISYEKLDIIPNKKKPHLRAPIDIKGTVWGAGVTYEKSRKQREKESEEGKKHYIHAYNSKMPEIFFKSDDDHSVGPNCNVGIRTNIDEKISTMMVPEPELVVVYGKRREIIGFTLGNDQTAIDIEKENPLFLGYAKYFKNCFSFGPCIITPEETNFDGYKVSLDIHLEIIRGITKLGEWQTNTNKMKRTLPELTRWLYRDRQFSQQPILTTGTGIITYTENNKDIVTLVEGDVVKISNPLIGMLTNYAKNIDIKPIPID